MLALKLLLVPTFLLLVSIAGSRWGPSVAGWLAGLPIVGGPILFFIALEQGTAFAAAASAAALSAVFASVAFSLVYAHASRRTGWPGALAAGGLAWLLAVLALARLPVSTWLAFAVAAATLVVGPRLFPPGAMPAGRRLGGVELASRMVAGAALTVGATLAAATMGSRWSGLIAVFPLLSSVLAVFSHRADGPLFAAALLRSLVGGMVSFATFCLVLAVSLVPLGIGPAFSLGVVGALAAQFATRRGVRTVRRPVDPGNRSHGA